jgi:hypothetical protein
MTIHGNDWELELGFWLGFERNDLSRSVPGKENVAKFLNPCVLCGLEHFFIIISGARTMRFLFWAFTVVWGLSDGKICWKKRRHA